MEGARLESGGPRGGCCSGLNGRLGAKEEAGGLWSIIDATKVFRHQRTRLATVQIARAAVTNDRELGCSKR